MKSVTLPEFWDRYAGLPEQIKQEARVVYTTWCNDPTYPSLEFKRLRKGFPHYSVRIAKGYRAVGTLDDDTLVWWWTGSHDAYMRLIAGLFR